MALPSSQSLTLGTIMEITIYLFKKSSAMISVFSLMSVLQEVSLPFISPQMLFQSESYDIDLFCQLDLHGWMQFRIQNAFFPRNCRFYEQFLTDPPINWDYGYYISINPKTWSHTHPEIKLPWNDPETVMQGEHINLFFYKKNVIKVISGIKHQIRSCQMCRRVFLQ